MLIYAFVELISLPLPLNLWVRTHWGSCVSPMFKDSARSWKEYAPALGSRQSSSQADPDFSKHLEKWKRGVVCEVPQAYIGKTKRMLKVRLSQLKQAVKCGNEERHHSPCPWVKPHNSLGWCQSEEEWNDWLLAEKNNRAHPHQAEWEDHESGWWQCGTWSWTHPDHWLSTVGPSRSVSPSPIITTTIIIIIHSLLLLLLLTTCHLSLIKTFPTPWCHKELYILGPITHLSLAL